MADNERRVTLAERDSGRIIKLLEDISAKLGPKAAKKPGHPHKKPAAKKAKAAKK